MIEFKEGKQFVSVEEDEEKQKVAWVVIADRFDKSGVYIDKDLYHLLQQAMPHIGAIVEGE